MCATHICTRLTDVSPADDTSGQESASLPLPAARENRFAVFDVSRLFEAARVQAGVELVQVLDALVHVVLDGSEGGHYCGGAKAVGDHREVGEGALDAWVEDRLGSCVAQGGPVLVQQVHQLLADESVKNM